jgi:electron transfer flavoprotein alpha/beta subunit
MMHIVASVKTVPDAPDLRFGDGGTLSVSNPTWVMNAFDEYAVEEALRLREAHGGKVTVLSVGPEEAVRTLRDGLALGADEAVLVSDPALDGADSIVAGAVLAAAVRKIGDVDVVLLGKQSFDEASQQVPPALAAVLDWASVFNVKKISAVENGELTVHRMTAEGHDVISLPTPCVLSVVKEINEPRLPSLKGKMKAKKAEVTTWTASDVGLDGLVARTKVEGYERPPERKAGEKLEGEPEEVAKKLVEKLRADGLI